MDRMVCKNCGLEIKWYEKTCPRCNCGEFVQYDYPRRDVVFAHSKIEFNHIMEECDTWIQTDYTCFLCNRRDRHYMIYPAKRDRGNYNILRKATVLPNCPVRIWELSEINIPFREFIDMLAVKEK